MNKSFLNTARVNFSKKYFIGRWYNNKLNWGDAINLELVKNLYGVNLIYENEIINITNRPIYSIVGSIINVFNRNKRIHIWGSGIANPKKPMNYIPEKIHSVRGPLTLEYLDKLGHKAPEIFGDPVLLINKIYPVMKVKKKYRLGIISHYADYLPWKIKNLEMNSIKCINILRNMVDPFSIIDEIQECENIIASSLHGLILADVYKIPNAWFFLQEYEKDRFKYLDYYQSIKSDRKKNIILKKNINLKELHNIEYYFNSLNLDLDMLLKSSPFYKSDLYTN